MTVLARALEIKRDPCSARFETWESACFDAMHEIFAEMHGRMSFIVKNRSLWQEVPVLRGENYIGTWAFRKHGSNTVLEFFKHHRNTPLVVVEEESVEAAVKEFHEKLAQWIAERLL